MRPSVSCGSVCRCMCETYARLDSRDKTMVAFCKPSICRHFTICFKTSLCVSRTSVCSKPVVCWVSEYDLTHAMRAHRAPFVFSASKPTTYRKPLADVRHAQWGCPLSWDSIVALLRTQGSKRVSGLSRHAHAAKELLLYRQRFEQDH